MIFGFQGDRGQDGPEGPIGERVGLSDFLLLNHYQKLKS